jgi:pimeloyl-ACP methyl ester carboxylesterase
VATFVLVHGAWHGAWCWRRVAGLLTRSGHEVFAPALTGLGERSHLLTSAIDLDTHILDVVNEMKWQQLNDVVLVGHSYGAMVIAGVAEKMERSVSAFVVVDGFLPETGQAVIDLQPQATQDSLRSALASGATTVPPRSAAFFHVNEKDRAFVDAQCTPQPLKCFLQKLTLTRARERIANKVYIRATGYPSEPFDLAMATARVT